MAGMREWLLREGINSNNVNGVREFGLVPEGVEREAILRGCLVALRGEGGGLCVESGFLQRVDKAVIKDLILDIAKHGVVGGEKELRWRSAIYAFRAIEMWVKANGGARRNTARGRGNQQLFLEVVGELDLLATPSKVLLDAVGRCKYVDAAWVEEIMERKCAAGDNAYELEYKVEKRYRIFGKYKIDFAENIAFHGDGPEQRMVIVGSPDEEIAFVVKVKTGKRLANVRFNTESDHPPTMRGVAFSRTGELYVSNFEACIIEVYDKKGKYKRDIGEHGRGPGQFNGPRGLAFTADDHLVVADARNNRVQVLRKDGLFLRSFGPPPSIPEHVLGARGWHPSEVAVGPDGSIAVLSGMRWCTEYEGYGRVHVFDTTGRMTMRIGKQGPGHGPGMFLNPTGLAVGGGGEIIVSDAERKTVKVFSREGELLQTIGEMGDSDVKWTYAPRHVVAERGGRIVVVDAPGFDIFDDGRKAEIVFLS